METTNPTQHCDHCHIGPFFYVADRLYPTLCLDCSDEAAKLGILCWVEGSGTCYFPPQPIVRQPGPFAFVRSAEQRAQDADHLARDLENERCDNTIWDRY